MKWTFRRNTIKKQKLFFPRRSGKRFVRGKKREKNDEEQQKETGVKTRVWSTAFLWLLFCGVAGYQIFLSGALSVSQISIEGTGLLSPDEVQQTVQEDLAGRYLGIFPRNNILLLPIREIEGHVQSSSPLIRHVEVRKIFPNSIEVSLLERGNLLFWCSGENSCQMLDEDGLVVDYPQATEEKRVPQFFLVDESGEQAHVGDQVINRKVMDFAKSLPQAFSEQSDIQIKERIYFPSKYADELRIETENGFEIRINADIPIEKTLNVLRIVREKAVPRDQREKIISIDLRVPGKAFYQVQNDEQKETDVSLGESNPKKKE